MPGARKCLRRSIRAWERQRLILAYGFVTLLLWCTIRLGSQVHPVHTYSGASAGVQWLHSQ